MNQLSTQLSILLPALSAGILVLSTHVPLGRRVLERGIIFIDLAIAQIAGLGVIAASYVGLDNNPWLVQMAAVTAALSGAVLLSWTERHWPETQEALIGLFFVLAASGSILLLSRNPHGSEHLKDLLVGQILWVDYQQLIAVAGLYILILLLWWKCSGYRMMFYLLFALAITASVQLVGVYLVFASLIIPALSVRSVNRAPNFKALLVGVGGYVVGLFGSAWLDFPSGPLIVWSMSLLALLVAVLGVLFGTIQSADAGA